MKAIVQRVSHCLGALLFAVLLAVFVIQVVARFFFDQPLPWTDELAVVLYIWLIFWAAAIMVKPKEHVAFDLLINAVSPETKTRMLRARYAVVAGLSAIALPASLDYILFMQREGTPVLGLPLAWVFLPFMLFLVSLVVWNSLMLIQSFRR